MSPVIFSIRAPVVYDYIDKEQFVKSFRLFLAILTSLHILCFTIPYYCWDLGLVVLHCCHFAQNRKGLQPFKHNQDDIKDRLEQEISSGCI